MTFQQDRILLILAVTMATVVMIQGCSCLHGHPHSDFCRADFVIRGRIVSAQVIYETYEGVNGEVEQFPVMRSYKMRQMKAYKFFNETKFTVAKKRHVYTPFDEGVCGIQLQVNQTYLLTGNVRSNKLHTGRCNWVQLWDELPPQQRAFLRYQRYARHCHCQIQHCMFEGECISDLPPLPGTCIYEPNKEYRLGDQREALCLKEASFCKSKGNGDCAWFRGPKLEECLKQSIQP